MNAGLAVLAALGEAACAAGASTLQHTTAARGRTAGWTATGQLARFARNQLAQSLWWASLAVQCGSLALHATALQLGPLTVVQPVTAIVVVLALPLNHRVNRTRTTRAELAWAAAATAGLAGFLIVAQSRPAPAVLATRHLVGPGIAAGILVAACLLIAHHGSARMAAVCLGAAAGIAFSIEAALLQAVTGPLLHHPLPTLISPTLYFLILTGAAGVALTQLAYRAGPISWALPAVITTNPVASVLLDRLVGPSGGPVSAATLVGEALTFALLVVAVAALARTTAHDTPR